MKKRILFLTFVLTTIISYGQIGDWLYALEGSDQITGIIVDDSGYVYITGYSENGDSIKLLNKAYFSPHIPSAWRYKTFAFISKIDSTGDLKWCKMMASPGWPIPGSGNISIDPKGDIVSNFTFFDTLVVENDTAIINPYPWTANYWPKSCLIKWDSKGNFKWLKPSPGRTSLNSPYYKYYNRSLSRIDKDGFIYLLTDSLISSQPAVTKGYIYKYGSNGNLMDAFQIEGSDLFIDSNKNLLVTGGNSIISKYDSIGVLQSNVNAIVGTPTSHKILADKKGNIYILGSSSSPFSLGGFNVSKGRTFIMKLSPALSVLWVKGIGNTQSWGESSFEVSDVGNIYASSIANRFFTFDEDTIETTRNSDTTAYIAKINTKGELQWAEIIDRNTSAINSIVKYKGSVYAAIESYYDTVYFDGLKHVANAMPIVLNTSFILKIIDGDNLLSGKVFIDSNSNSNPDPLDRFLPWQIIKIGTVDYTITNKNGLYELLVPKGSYNVTYLSPKFVSSPSNHSINFTSNFQKDTNNHFVATCPPNLFDLSIKITPFYYRTALNNPYTKVHIEFNNRGCVPISDTIVLKFDTNLILFDSSSYQPISSNGNLIKWSFNNLKPFESRQFNVHFSHNQLSVSDTIHYLVSIGPQNDSFPSNNIDSAYQEVVAAFDPNDKQVHPSGDVKPAYVKDGKYFIYTVRFQNTGTSPAVYVRIRDTLSKKLNIETFEIITSSHNYKVELTSPNVFDFIFDPIFLPDSGANIDESMGFIKFRIKADPTLSHGDFFENTAYIYFDNNEPVVTNTTHTEISDWAGFENLDKEEKGIHIYPNPAKSEFSILLKNPSKSAVNIEIIDITGRIVFSKRNMKMNSDVITLSSLNLTKGIYVVKVVQDVQFYNSKIVIE